MTRVTPVTSDEQEQGPDREPRGFWIGLAIGLPIVVFGIAGLVSTTPFAAVVDVATWVVGLNLAHDIVLAPLVCVVGVVLARSVPLPWRAAIRAALVATAIATLLAYPALRGFGRDTVPDNPTVQPLDSTTALLTVIGVIWALALVWLLAIATRRHRRRARGDDGNQDSRDVDVAP
jgi:hypothetical protein